MNNKNYFIFAAAIALASCSVDEYMGENPEFTQTTKENIIGFGGGTGSMSRATSNEGTTEQMLDKQFKVYGWKTVKVGTTNTTQKVFEDYWVWYEGTNKTPSNPDATDGANDGWEYVGVKDKQMPFKKPDNSSEDEVLEKTQYIKYWDYSASEYKFVAGSPISAFTFVKATGDQNAIASATVEGLAGHIIPNSTNTAMTTNPVYIAKPVKITKDASGEHNSYGNPVKFDFVRQQSKVRVGIYETIKGYRIKSIEFYEDASTSTTTNNVILFTEANNYFVGGSNITGTVTYNWNDTPNPSYTFQYDDASVTKDTKWYGGKFEGIKATSSNPSKTSSNSTIKTDIIEEFYGKDKDMDAETGYFIVLPTPSATNASALTLRCKYILESEDGSNETITVTGATAAIPAAYCKWEPNKMYTYIFKISKETNGTTGTVDQDPEGLFPITFDAAAIAETDAKEGYETIINSPSITTYQKGSVTDNGIEYKTGEEIVITVTDDNGSLKTNLQTTTNNSEGYIAVYKLSEEKTEAELVVNRPSGSTKDVTIAGNTAKFTPEKVDITGEIGTYGYYAIEYCYKLTPSPVYKYKVIKVIKN